MFLTEIIKRITNKFGFDIVRTHHQEQFASDISQSLINTYKKVKPYTMTSAERIFSLCDAVRYITNQKIEGDIVECGVWKGGSMMAIADSLINMEEVNRNLYLFDTFDGMVEPTLNDVDIGGVLAKELMSSADKSNDDSVWCCAGLDVVRQAMDTIGYPENNVHYVQGRVEETIPLNAPSKIALLRLDTDWYESTKHEMEHLFPRLVKGGILIIDDYGHWKGARKAVDDYIHDKGINIFLNRIDYTGRIAVKLD